MCYALQDWTKNPNGGVFRHQSPDGYGIFYIEGDSVRTKFVITASKTSQVSRPKEFCRELIGVFNDINALIQTHLDASNSSVK